MVKVMTCHWLTRNHYHEHCPHEAVLLSARKLRWISPCCNASTRWCWDLKNLFYTTSLQSLNSHDELLPPNITAHFNTCGFEWKRSLVEIPWWKFLNHQFTVVWRRCALSHIVVIIASQCETITWNKARISDHPWYTQAYDYIKFW